ncbi:MAG: oligopeptide/dipeptide ABC transporter ATP-binding protein [Pseudomonadota bacterium]
MTYYVLEADNINKEYLTKSGVLRMDTRIKALNNVSLKLARGQTLAIIGESNSGKSTLGRVLVGSETPSTGSIRIDGTKLDDASTRLRREAHRKIRLIFQNANQSLNPRIRIKSLLDDTLRFNTPLNAEQRDAKIKETLKLVGVRSELAERYPHMLSMGDRQRIAIARAIILEPLVLVADEPLAHLDMSIQAQILNLLLKLQEELGFSYLFISNDLGMVKHMADEIMVLCDGQVMEQGNSRRLFHLPNHPYTRALFSGHPSLIGSSDAIVHVKKLYKSATSKTEKGCPFYSRCPFASQSCEKSIPELEYHDDVAVACHKTNEINALSELHRKY